MTTHYEALGVTPDATPDELKRAYRAFSRKHHPDIAGPESEPIFAAGAVAYTILSDPEKRAAYDRSLTQPTPDPEPDEPLDSWAETTEETGWDATRDDSEPIDVIVEDTPPPTPEPATAPTGEPDIDSEPITVTDRVPPPIPLSLLGLVAGTLTALASPYSATVMGALTLVGFGIIAGFIIYTTMKPSPKKQQPDLQPITRNTIVAALIIVAIPLTAALVLTSNKTNPLTWLAVPALTGMATAALTVPVAQLIHANTKIVKKKALRAHEIFGTPPPGYAPALLNNALMGYLVAHPTTRLFQLPDPQAFFSHALVNGTNVVLLRAIGAPSGTYQWSGTTLLYSNNRAISAPLEGDYRAALARITKHLPKTGTVTAAIVVMRQPEDRGAVQTTPPPAGYPDIIADTNLPAFINAAFVRDQPQIRRDVLCDTIRAMLRQRATN